MKKKYLSNILLTITSIMLTFFCVEGFLRFFWKDISGRVIPLSLEIHRKSQNTKLGYELIPNSSVLQDGVMYTINSIGIRDFNVYGTKKPADIRIAAVGDSFTFGLGVELMETWPKQLEKLLKADKHVQAIQVMNFGVMGYDTHQEIELIKNKVFRHSPDIIIIGYYMNDVGAFSRERAEIKKLDSYQRFMSTGIHGLDDILNKSRLYCFIKDRIFYKKRMYVEVKREDLSEKEREELQRQWEEYVKLENHYKNQRNIQKLKAWFKTLGEMSKATGIPFIVAIFPQLKNLKSYPLIEANQLIVNETTKNGLNVIDYYPIMKEYNEKTLRISRSNLHFNPFGCRIVAEHMYRFLREKNFFNLLQ